MRCDRYHAPPPGLKRLQRVWARPASRLHIGAAAVAFVGRKSGFTEDGPEASLAFGVGPGEGIVTIVDRVVRDHAEARADAGALRKALREGREGEGVLVEIVDAGE